MAGWVGHMAALLEPLAERIARHVGAGAALHADDTPVPRARSRPWPNENRPTMDGGERREPLWIDEPPAAFYLYSPDRRAERAHALLRGCRGHLHADAYAGFAGPGEADPLTGARPADGGRLLDACAAQDLRHPCRNEIARRGQALEMIARLFAIEADIEGRPPAERLAARRAKSTPILSELRGFLDATMEKVSGKSSLASAFATPRSAGQALTRYVDDGGLEMSNNVAERAMRPLALAQEKTICSPAPTRALHTAHLIMSL